MGLLFVPLRHDDALAGAMRSWEWLPQLAFVGFLTVLFYLACRAVTLSMGCGRIALLLTGVVMLAGALADVTGLAIATWNFAKISPQDAESSPLRSLNYVMSFWPSDALFLALWIGIQVSLATIVAFVLRWVFLASKDGAASVRAVTGDPRIRDVPGRATKLAVLGIMPVLAAAMVGGVDRFNPDAVQRKSPLDYLLIDYIFSLRLRVTPPGRGNFDQADVAGGSEKWLVPTAIAVIFVCVLWLVLRFVVVDLGSPPTVAGVTVVVIAWGVTVLVGAIVGLLDSTISAVLAQVLGRDSYFWYEAPVTLVKSMSFGVHWGWLVGLLVLLGYRGAHVHDAYLPGVDQQSHRPAHEPPPSERIFAYSPPETRR